MNIHKRQYTIIDKVLCQLDSGLRMLSGQCEQVQRSYPANDVREPQLTNQQRQHSAGLMRVNHVGEICAQALYQGQALTARQKSIRKRMEQSAAEETDHLSWCQQRINELNSHVSYLNPAWYLGALTLGIAAGLAGDKWNLGFVAETEHQVVKHLESHLERLPKNDIKSHIIVVQMRDDEAKHATIAEQLGGATLPKPIKLFMRQCAKIMATIAYYI